MSWVNLDDVYVNKTGDTIAGDLSVGGALTINDGKGTDTTYNVANEITTLRDSVSQVSLYSGNTTFSGALNIGVISDNYRRIELSITIDNVVTTHFINNPTTSVDYAIPLIYIPSGTELRRIAFTRISFTSDGHTYLSRFTFVDNLGSISTLDNIKAKIDIVGYK